MQLKKYTDYALRVLIYCASKEEGELSSIKEIAGIFSISQDHLGKIVHQLNRWGYIETVRGRYGGIKLAKRKEDINVGMIVRKMEDDFTLLECFDTEKNHCILSPACTLKHALHEALEAFFSVLDSYTLADLVGNPSTLKILLERTQ